ncbi:hypothetical protein RvY_17871 [Ramazzottius varieornatus]|uniref:Uncharacterized protein n=1 Tax=Ramazzottius varieornatus TaxID=947166 RepID=A0A1D1W5N8_RAMVA|nr:hypothetical protein RvY_17871 [Ramazzottius varieornatus]
MRFVSVSSCSESINVLDFGCPLRRLLQLLIQRRLEAARICASISEKSTSVPMGGSSTSSTGSLSGTFNGSFTVRSKNTSTFFLIASLISMNSVISRCPSSDLWAEKQWKCRLT